MWIASISSGLSVAAFVALVVMFLSMVSDRGRDGMDPPPAIFAPFMSLIRVFTFYITSNFSDEKLIQLEEKLKARGVSFMVTAEEFFAGQIALAFVFVLAGTITTLSGGGINL